MYQEKWDALSPGKQKALEIAVGILLAIGSLVFLSISVVNEKTSFFDLNALIAFAIMLIIPRILTNQTGSPLKVLRKYMLVSFIIGLVFIILDSFVFKIFH